jgi:Undecaprenyl-phosphate glucose phosphotransferase
MAIFFAYVFAVEPDMTPTYLTASLATASIAILTFQAFKLYTIPSLRTYAVQLSRLAGAWSLVFGVLMAAVFLAKQSEEFSRVWLASWYLTGLVVLPANRAIAAILIRRWSRQGRLERRAVIVGGGDKAAKLIEALKASTDSDIRICGIFDDRDDARSPPVVAGYPKLGKVRELVDFARRTRIDLLIVSLPITAETRVLEMLRTLWVLPVDIRLSAHTEKLRFRPRAYSYIGNVPFLDVFDKPIADWDYVAKTLFDRILGTALLIATLPVMGLVALAIKLDSRGPALFKQNRYGFNNELIGVYKFRSMHADQTDATANRLVTKDDPRVTRVGRFIRKTSLDELPQLFNVVKGELSLVGPRPHAVHAKAQTRLYDQVVDGYFARHRVKPGITGWAQINGWRGETDTEEKIHRRVEHDLYYIENWSVAFDLYILLRTPLALLRHESAY